MKSRAPKSANTVTLPDPVHPFARWAGVTVVSLWAVGAQSLQNPFDKLLALLSPGIGYIVGHGLDKFMRWADRRSIERVTRKELDSIEKKIEQLRHERLLAENSKINPSLLELIDTTINNAMRAKIEIMRGTIVR